jgi:hypothetical protein
MQDSYLGLDRLKSSSTHWSGSALDGAHARRSYARAWNFQHMSYTHPRIPRRQLAWALTAGLLLMPACAVAGTGYPGFQPTVTDSTAVFPVPAVALPGYLSPLRDPTFGTWIVRIAGDPGKRVGTLNTPWSPIARHVYSKQQPWNANETLLSLENRGGTLTPLLLDGQSYLPVRGPCANYARWDYRWHPSPEHANEQVNVNRLGTELMWFDVTQCVKTRTWALPIVAAYGIGSGEGNVSLDGRYVVVASASQMVVVDMDPQAPDAPAYPFRRMGPVYTFEPCSLDVAQPNLCTIDNVSISPSGHYIDVKFQGVALAGTLGCDTLCDMHRIFEVDSSLAIRPHAMADNSLRCSSFSVRPNGWTFPLKHADMALDPFDNNEDVIIGGRACPGSNIGHVVKVRLRDGRVTALTSSVNEPAYSHGSARNLTRPGWFYVTYSRDPVYAGRKYFGEVVAVKLDGSGSVQRFAHFHSTQSRYDSEAQAVPSPDGRRLLMASDWSDYCLAPCGSVLTAQDYVVDARDTGPLDVTPDVAALGLALMPQHPNPSTNGIVVRFALPSAEAATLELFDLLGRRLRSREVGSLGSGEHTLDFGPGVALHPGVYFVTLRSGSQKLSTRAVVVH